VNSMHYKSPIFDSRDPMVFFVEFVIVLIVVIIAYTTFLILAMLLSPYFIVKKILLKRKQIKYDYVSETIDTPIVDVCDRMTKLGLVTTNSCCGFTYPDEGLKSHANPYIGFNATFTDMKRFASKFNFPGNVWNIRYAPYRIQKYYESSDTMKEKEIDCWVLETQARGKSKIWDQIRGCLDRIESEEE